MTHVLDALEWVISGLGFASAWLLGRRRLAGWWCSLVSQVLWLYVAVVTRQWAFVLASFIYGYLAFQGWRRWRRDTRSAG